MDIIISDHKATLLSIIINVSLSTFYYREVWNYKNADYTTDYTTLNNLIEEFNWASIINESSSVDEACLVSFLVSLWNCAKHAYLPEMF